MIEETLIYFNNPKVKEARKLLFEAYKETVKTIRIQSGHSECECGHTRDEHTPSYDVNFLGGMCLKCHEKKDVRGCLNFLERR